MPTIPWKDALKNGIFAALFIMLLVYTMNENKAREQQYQQTIHEVNAVNSKYADIIKIDLAEIKARIGVRSGE
jgi:hypothetical protein